MEPSLYFPVKDPIDQANLFGTVSPMYTALGQKGHPGIDFESASGTPVYAPCDGSAFYVTDKDGGCGLWIRTPNNAAPHCNIILWHMYPKDAPNPDNLPNFPYAIPTDGSLTPVKAGQLLGYSDTSGYPIESTGPHLHIGVMPSDETGEALTPQNGFLGCVDPTPYFNQKYAQDIGTKQKIVDAVATVVQDIPQLKSPLTNKKQFLKESPKFLKSFSDSKGRIIPYHYEN